MLSITSLYWSFSLFICYFFLSILFLKYFFFNDSLNPWLSIYATTLSIASSLFFLCSIFNFSLAALFPLLTLLFLATLSLILFSFMFSFSTLPLFCLYLRVRMLFWWDSIVESSLLLLERGWDGWSFWISYSES